MATEALMAWLVFGVVQLIIGAFGLGLLSGRMRPRRNLPLVFIGTGVLLLAINFAWYASGAMEGPYAPNMRGGMRAFWFSTITFLELLLLGIAAALNGPKSRNGSGGPTRSIPPNE